MATRKKTRSTRSTKNPKTGSASNNPSSKKITTEARRAHLRSTISGPMNPKSTASAGDPLAIKFDATQKLAADMPYNVNKPLEHGELAMEPPEGPTATPEDPSASGSTLTETLGPTRRALVGRRWELIRQTCLSTGSEWTRASRD